MQRCSSAMSLRSAPMRPISSTLLVSGLRRQLGREYATSLIGSAAMTRAESHNLQLLDRTNPAAPYRSKVQSSILGFPPIQRMVPVRIDLMPSGWKLPPRRDHSKE
jgi:hypothetical protein